MTLTGIIPHIMCMFQLRYIEQVTAACELNFVTVIEVVWTFACEVSGTYYLTALSHHDILGADISWRYNGKVKYTFMLICV